MDTGSSEEGSSSGSGAGTTTTGGLATTTLETTTMTQTTGPGTAESESSGETGLPAEVCDEHGSTDACCCFWTDDGYHKVECPTTPLCEGMPIEILCTDDAMAPECGELTVEVVAEEGLDCALQALEEGSSGVIHYEVVSKANPGAWRQEWDLYLQGDGTAYVRALKASDAGGGYEPLAKFMLADAETINKCRMDEVSVRIGCLRAAAIGDAIEECLDASVLPDA